MNNQKKVLITGATGFIGRAAVEALEYTGWGVVKASRSVKLSSEEGFIYLDISSPEKIMALANEYHFDAIVHLAGMVDFSNDAESELFIPNVLSTGCLAYLAKLWGAHLIYASTAIVHGAKNENIKSDSPINPDTAYAKSKWLGEQLILSAKIKYCILRIVGVFGCDASSHLGLNRAIDEAIKGEPPVQIGTGVAIRNYIYVKDVALAIQFALDKHLEGIHLLAGQEITSITEMLQQICDEFLPGSHPIMVDGALASNQIVMPSSALPETRKFNEALIDIKNECNE